MATESPPPVPPYPAKSPRRRREQLSYLVISGGTGANSFASAFGPAPAFVLPVSDDGGSSAEILRCFGGPSIGDIRSRLIRLIPTPAATDSSPEARERRAIYNLMAHRFPADVPEKTVREQWQLVVEGRGMLWDNIGEDKRECIRAFLAHFQMLCLRRAHKRFSFRNFSIGNGFLTGARDLFSNLSSAIFLFKSIGGVNEGAQVIPIINTNQTITITAQLENGAQLVGQCNISHPAPPPEPTHLVRSNSRPSRPRIPGARRDSRTFDTADTPRSAHTPRTPHTPHTPRTPNRDPHPLHALGLDLELEGGADDGEDAIGSGNIMYTKGMAEVPLEARVERLFYINLYGQEIFPPPHPDFLRALDERDVLVYSCGSLWTSIAPCLALRMVATSIASSQSLKAKVLLLNSKNDRETPEFTALDYIDTIAAMLRHYDIPPPMQDNPDDVIPWETRAFITHVAYLEGGFVDVDEEAIIERGLRPIMVPISVHGSALGTTPMFSTDTVQWTMDRVLDDLGL